MKITKSNLLQSLVAMSSRRLVLFLSGTALLLPGPIFAETNSYEQTILVANRPEYKPVAFVDKYLVNPWGIALRPPGKGGHIWVSNAQNATTTTYIGDVNGEPLRQDGLKVIGMDGPLFSYEDGVPNVTGQVYNAASDTPGQPVEFLVSGSADDLSTGKPVSIGISSGPAKFVFVTTDGTINAWRANTAESMKSAVIVKDCSDRGRDLPKGLKYIPAYTGVAMTTAPFVKDGAGQPVADNRLYVTDFQNGRIQVFDNQWREITAKVPFERPAGMKEEFSPYNIQEIGGKLYVAYAVIDPLGEEPAFDVAGKGNGHIAVYDRDGKLLKEFKDEGWLNSPWGVTISPDGFGAMSGKLLVANFGDGTIAAFDPDSGEPVDYLRDKDYNLIVVDGVWGIVFGNGVSLGDAHALYFTAGPETEQDGIFGRLNAAR
jgi:uncharacterized protein (TIGR03118 family)